MKTLAIDRLLNWAYRTELPKEQARGLGFLRPQGWSQPWAAVTKNGMLGTEVQEADVRNRFGVVPDMTASSDPHPDATRVWMAVQDLAKHDEIDLPEGWNPIPDLGDFGTLSGGAIVRGIAKACIKDATGALRTRETSSPHYLIEFHSIMGNAPDWTFPVPIEKVDRHANGTPKYFIREVLNVKGENIEVETDNGYDKVGRRPKAGAYTKPYLDPDPAGAVVDRIKYRIWHSACAFLTEDLAGRLDEHNVRKLDLPGEPWEPDQKRRVPVILRDLRVPQPSIGGGAASLRKAIRSAA